MLQEALKYITLVTQNAALSSVVTEYKTSSLRSAHVAKQFCDRFFEKNLPDLICFSMCEPLKVGLQMPRVQSTFQNYVGYPAEQNAGFPPIVLIQTECVEAALGLAVCDGFSIAILPHHTCGLISAIWCSVLGMSNLCQLC